MRWTEERKELVKRLWDSGLSASQICAEVGAYSRNAIIGLIHRQGWHRGDAIIKKIAAAKQQRKRLAKVAPRRFSKVVPLIPFDAAKVGPNLTPADAKPVTLIELTEHTCRWPLGDFDKPVEFFCGASADNRTNPYCFHHQHISRYGSAELFQTDGATIPVNYEMARLKSALNSRAATRPQKVA